MAEGSSLRVVRLTAEETHGLRLDVLRRDMDTQVVTFPEDADPAAVHLGVRDGDELVATSTWIPRPYEGRPAVQLRGMATAWDRQGTGLGGVLIDAGVAHARSIGVHVVWANARDSALAFYERHGFEVAGDGFNDASTTKLPHHVVVRHLS